MTISAPDVRDSKSQLRKTMGFWDVLLFNIATVLGPRWCELIFIQCNEPKVHGYSG